MQSKSSTSVTALVQLSEVKINEIAQRLAPQALISKEGESLGAASRPAHRNVVLPCFSQEGRDRIFASLSLLFEVHPSRFFVVDLRSEHKQPSASVGEPFGDTAGSQVVVFQAAPHQLSEIVELIRAHVLVGVQTELTLLDGALLPEALTALLPIADIVMLESHLFDHLGGSGWGDGRAALLSELLKSNIPIIDSGWLRLSAIREELRRAFDFLKHSTPRSLEISYTPVANTSVLPTVAVLAAAWCCDRLGARSLITVPEGAAALCDGGERMSITFKASETAKKKVSKTGTDDEFSGAEVTGLRLISTGSKVNIEINAGSLRSNIESETKIHAERAYEREGNLERWRRYFVIGESVTNYRSAMRLAIPLFR